jgi:cytochrome c oxidase accessory protein FixG
MAKLQPTLESVTTINDDGSRRFVHPADVRGRFTRLRAVVGWLLIAIYAALPWIPVNGNPAVFFDIAGKQMHFFGLTFVPQDFWIAFFLITGLGFGLFYLTALVGRIWCGWTCPQTVFIEQVFRRVERLLEGDAPARRRLDNAPWSAEKLLRRGTKWGIFALCSIVIAHLFISYFVSLPKLYTMMRQSPLEHWGVFLFVFALSGALFFDFVWFREQFCIVMCPYGRLQSVLIDNDSVVIGYDQKRGEPRGKPNVPGVGDCIDCLRCVQVCPTGIDIRQGIQIECINCANCIDACDAVMAKIGRPKGLIRYDSTHGLEGKRTRILRPRMILYTLLLALGACVMAVSVSTLKPATVSLLRMPGAPYYTSGGTVRNQYLVRIDNKRNRPVQFTVKLLTQQPGIVLSGAEETVEVPAHGHQLRPIVVTVPEAEYRGAFDAEFETATDSLSIRRTVRFLGPDPK